MPKPTSSPRWSNTAKLIAGFTLVAIAAALLIRFSDFIGPLLLAFVLTYLLHPLARRLSERMHLSWSASVNLIFAAFILVLGILMAVAGFAIVDQVDNLVRALQTLLSGLPEFAASLSSQAVQIGPFVIDFAGLERVLIDEFSLNYAALSQQLLAALQPVLGRAGSFITALATSAITTIAWTLFIFIISYLTLTEMGGAPAFFKNADWPGYDADFRRLGSELGRIWNSFLRGQVLIVFLVIISAFVLFSLLGLHYSLGLAIITGLAKFIPYVGPFVVFVTTFLVALFQGGNYLNIQPQVTYAIVMVVGAIIIDQTFDNIIVPRIYGRSLGVHPAAVLVAALVAASLLGIVGLLLAAPVLASLQLFAIYAIRKMLDLDPWPQVEAMEEPNSAASPQPLKGLANLVQRFLPKKKKKPSNK